MVWWDCAHACVFVCVCVQRAQFTLVELETELCVRLHLVPVSVSVVCAHQTSEKPLIYSSAVFATQVAAGHERVVQLVC